MKHTCYKCKKYAGGPRVIVFEYKGMAAHVFKDGMTCEECEKKQWKDHYENDIRRFVGDLVSVSDGKTIVDWTAYHKVFSERRSEGLKDRVNYFLMDVGIFSVYSERNWEIVSAGPIGLNPRTFGATYLYFVRKEDAIEYARLERGRTLYNWEIRHIDKVIPKDKIVKSRN